MYSIRIFDHENEGQGRWRFGWKLTGESIFSTCICLQKLALLGPTVCSQCTNSTFRNGRTHGCADERTNKWTNEHNYMYVQFQLLWGELTFPYCVSALWLFRTVCFRIRTALAGNVCFRTAFPHQNFLSCFFLSFSLSFFLYFFLLSFHCVSYENATCGNIQCGIAQWLIKRCTDGAEKTKCRNIRCGNVAKPLWLLQAAVQFWFQTYCKNHIYNIMPLFTGDFRVPRRLRRAELIRGRSGRAGVGGKLSWFRSRKPSGPENRLIDTHGRINSGFLFVWRMWRFSVNQATETSTGPFRASGT